MATRQDYADLFVSANVALTNGRDDADIQPLLAAYGYDTDRLDDGLALLTAAEEAASRQTIEYGEKEAATHALAVEFGAFRAVYLRHVTLARVAFKEGTAGYTTLGLQGDRADDLAGLLAQGRAFYRGLLGSPALLAAMASFNVDQAAVEAALGEADDVEEAKVAQAQEYGEAQVATRVRDDAVGVLEGFLRDYYAVAKVALEDHPQLREKLGLLERGAF